MTLPDPDTVALSEFEDSRANPFRWVRNIVILLVGGALFCFYVIAFATPLANAIYASNWEPTPCTVLESALDEQKDNEGGTAYSLALKYGYYVKFASGDSPPAYWEGTRYDFQVGADSNRDYWNGLATTLRPGQACTCYVDPTDPSQAALNISIGRPLWRAILWSPLGLAIFTLPWFWWRQKTQLAARWRIGKPWFVVAREAFRRKRKSTTLKGGDTATNRLLGFAVFLVFIVGFGVAASALFAFPFSSNRLPLLGLFTVPMGILFGGVSLLFACLGIASFFDPRMLIELDHAQLVLGKSANLRYRVTGKLQRISSFTINLRCNYVDASNDTDERFPLYESQLIKLDGPFLELEGCCLVPIPTVGPSSVQFELGRIEWEVTALLIPFDGPEQRATLVFPVESEPFQLQAVQHSQNVVGQTPPSPLSLKLEPKEAGVLKGQVNYELSVPISSIDLRLFWYTEGQLLYEPVVPAAATVISVTASAGEALFSLKIPTTPKPYHSDKINVRWALEAIARPSGFVTRLDLELAEPRLAVETPLGAAPVL